MLATISDRELRRWRTYWEEEPWGAYRDNFHTALIISQLLRPSTKDGKAPAVKEFMLMHPEDRKAEGAQDFITKLDMLARAQQRDARKKAKAEAESPKIIRKQPRVIYREKVKRHG